MFIWGRIFTHQLEFDNGLKRMEDARLSVVEYSSETRRSAVIFCAADQVIRLAAL
jgi:hypothetical protein